MTQTQTDVSTGSADRGQAHADEDNREDQRAVTEPASSSATVDVSDVPAYCRRLTDQAMAAAASLRATPASQRDEALHQAAAVIRRSTETLQQANQLDLQAGRAAGLAPAMLDRLELTDSRLADLADSIEQIAEQPDPVDRVLEGRTLPNGIKLRKLSTPIGVVLIIFESRPNVTGDAAALCLKSANSVILRGGKEAVHSNAAITRCIDEGLESAGVHRHAVQLVGTTDRQALGELLTKEGQIDLCIPRGGKSLIEAVVDQARIPVIKHYTGNCHLYIDRDCDAEAAIKLSLNAKTQRSGVCNAVETILVHRDAAEEGLLSRLCTELSQNGVEVRGDARTCAAFSRARTAEEDDWHTEYLDHIVAVRVVDSLDAGIEHINRYGSRHTDGIVTRRLDVAEQFTQRVDTANVMINCSTRFSDGKQYGLGAEIGISTDKLHARGPMGATDLTTYKWVAQGSGQLRR